MTTDRTGRRMELFSEALRLAPDGTTLARVCAGTLPLLDVTGAVIAMMSDDDGGGGVLSAAGPTARATFDLQFSLGEGPSRDAYAGDTEVIVDDLFHDGARRWPAFAAAAQEQGIRSMYTFPARIGAIRVGVLHLERDTSQRMSSTQLDDARVLAGLCSTLIIDRQAGIAEPASTPWPDRAVVHQATGMVATQLGVPLAAALARLRAYAFTNETPLEVAARAVVDRQLRLDH